MDSLLQDVRQAVRQLFRSPGISAIIILTLALGIGANSMLFSIVHAALLRPLPYPHAERLVSLSVATPEKDKEVMEVSGAQLVQERARSLEALASYAPDGATLAGGGEPQLLAGADVSADFFRVMGVHPALGRELSGGELRRNGPPVVILGAPDLDTGFRWRSPDRRANGEAGRPGLHGGGCDAAGVQLSAAHRILAPAPAGSSD